MHLIRRTTSVIALAVLAFIASAEIALASGVGIIYTGIPPRRTSWDIGVSLYSSSASPDIYRGYVSNNAYDYAITASTNVRRIMKFKNVAGTVICTFDETKTAFVDSVHTCGYNGIYSLTVTVDVSGDGSGSATKTVND